MIEDKELRDLFKIESEEHLLRLNDGLLRLEKNPGDQTTLEETLREAHSLKGAARMIGLSDIETLSHCLENVLSDAKKGKTALSPEKINGMFYGLDAIKKLVQEAVTGESSA